MTLGEKLKHLRQENSLTQKDLADKLHVSFQTVSKWENGENEPDISTLRELAKLFDCSVDYLINEDEIEHEEESERNKEDEGVTKTIVVHEHEKHVCARCGKEIDEEDIAAEDVTKRVRRGRSYRSVTIGQTLYHKGCFEEVLKERAEAKQKARVLRTAKSKKLSFFWGIFGGSLALIITLIALLVGAKTLHPAISILISVVVGYGIFSMLYCIISGSYIGEVFVWCAGLSIKFPGLIFSWDLEGFAWLIAMKVLFAVLGFLIGVFALLFAIAFSAALGMISFPFVLIHNENNGYEDSLID